MDSTVLMYFALLSNSSFEHFILNFPCLLFALQNISLSSFNYTMLYIYIKLLIKVIVFGPSAPATTAPWLSCGQVHVLKWTIGYNKVL